MDPKLNRCQCICCRTEQADTPKTMYDKLNQDRKDAEAAMHRAEAKLRSIKNDMDRIKTGMCRNKLCRVWGNQNDYTTVRQGVTIRLIERFDTDCNRFIDAHGTKWINAVPLSLEEVEQYLL
jgi:hypothetical protein